MTKCSAIFLAATIALLQAPDATAETGIVSEATYTPIVERSNGRYVTCGIHYSAIVQGTDRVMGVQGSWNSIFLPEMYPGMSLKAVAFEPDNGNVKRVGMFAANYKGRKFNTFDMMQEAGEFDSRLIFFSIPDSIDVYENFQSEVSSGFWVFLTLDEARNDFGFKLPVFDKLNGGEDALLEMSHCTREALGVWIEENE